MATIVQSRLGPDSLAFRNVTEDKVAVSATASVSGEVSVLTFATDYSETNPKLRGVGTPANSNDAANKAYVDSKVQGLDIKGACVVATTGPVAGA